MRIAFVLLLFADRVHVSCSCCWQRVRETHPLDKAMAAARKTVWVGNLAEETTLTEPMELGPQHGTPALAEKNTDNTEFSTSQTAEDAPSLPP